jgi:hypothetical protein
MDYLYDKVKPMINWKKWFKEVIAWRTFRHSAEYERYWTSYVALLENHDEQRLASPEFAGTPEKENLWWSFPQQ